MTADTQLLIIAAVRCVIAACIATTYYAFFGRIWFSRPIRAARFAVGCSVLSVATLIRTFALFGPAFSTAVMAVAMLSIGLILWLPMSALRFIICFFTCLLSEFMLEYATNAIYVYFSPGQVIMTRFGSTEVMTSPLPAMLVMCGLTAVIVAFALLVSYIIRTHGRMPGNGRYWLRTILVLVLLLGAIIVISVSATQALRGAVLIGQSSGVKNSMVGNVPVYYLPLAILILVFWELVQQFRLFQSNRALADRNAAYQSILDSKREFAHNIANLIYGFEGVILTEDMGAIRSYYAELSRRCVLNNNENAAALNRVDNPVLTALLLRKLDRATALEIPVYLTADAGFAFDGIPAARLADVIGNLLDNAIEAAQRSESPRVDVTLCRTGDADTILIDNTFAPDADLSFLSGEAKSSKPDHQATGLESVRRTLRRSPEVCFNQYLRGRYVETNLCDYRRRVQ